MIQSLKETGEIDVSDIRKILENDKSIKKKADEYFGA